MGVSQFTNQRWLTMAHCRIEDFEIGRKTFARYNDEYNDIQINFIPTYVVEENNSLYIGTKNNMVGTSKGYYQLQELTGKDQLNGKYLTNIYLKKKD